MRTEMKHHEDTASYVMNAPNGFDSEVVSHPFAHRDELTDAYFDFGFEAGIKEGQRRFMHKVSKAVWSVVGFFVFWAALDYVLGVVHG